MRVQPSAAPAPLTGLSVTLPLVAPEESPPRADFEQKVSLFIFRGGPWGKLPVAADSGRARSCDVGLKGAAVGDFAGVTTARRRRYRVFALYIR